MTKFWLNQGWCFNKSSFFGWERQAGSAVVQKDLTAAASRTIAQMSAPLTQHEEAALAGVPFALRHEPDLSGHIYIGIALSCTRVQWSLFCLRDCSLFGPSVGTACLMNATGINVQRMAQRANSKLLNIFGASPNSGKVCIVSTRKLQAFSCRQVAGSLTQSRSASLRSHYSHPSAL